MFSAEPVSQVQPASSALNTSGLGQSAPDPKKSSGNPTKKAGGAGSTTAAKNKAQGGDSRSQKNQLTARNLKEWNSKNNQEQESFVEGKI